MTVDERLREARARAAQADAVVLVEAAFAARGGARRHAGQALHGVGDVLVRQLADFLGGHHFRDAVGVALGFQRALQRAPQARDLDGDGRRGGGRWSRCRRGGRLREENSIREEDRGCGRRDRPA
jgi:hypothetical protein